MADETRTTGTTGSELATPNTPTSAQTVPAVETAQEKPAEPQYVTREVLDQTIAETLRRAKQSDRDRIKQIDDKLNTIKTRLESGGAQLTPQQVNVLREQIEEEDSVEQVAAQASAVTPEMQAQVDFIYDQLDETFADVGTTVTTNDPEWAAIKEALDDPKGSLAKMIRIAAKQAEAKAVRVASQQAAAPARAVSAGGQQTTTSKKLSAEEKLSQGLSGNWSETRR